jgi:hypothetical protein
MKPNQSQTSEETCDAQLRPFHGSSFVDEDDGGSWMSIPQIRFRLASRSSNYRAAA